ncbi:MAG: hypothetical protein HND47_10205 [Chloroflexi bacterium]|nr:hypothetical protein [Chloroflexota bacterium]
MGVGVGVRVMVAVGAGVNVRVGEGGGSGVRLGVGDDAGKVNELHPACSKIKRTRMSLRVMLSS